MCVLLIYSIIFIIICLHVVMCASVNCLSYLCMCRLMLCTSYYSLIVKALGVMVYIVFKNIILLTCRLYHYTVKTIGYHISSQKCLCNLTTLSMRYPQILNLYSKIIMDYTHSYSCYIATYYTNCNWTYWHITVRCIFVVATSHTLLIQKT